jgi:hypothetical protein
METTPEDKKKAARKAYQKKYREENREVIKVNAANRYKENSESIKIKNKIYYLENCENINTRNKIYRENHIESRKIYDKNRYIEIGAANVRKIYKKNYEKTRRNNDPIYKMVCNLRTRIGKALRFQGATKDIRTKDLFGADQEFVWKHLESKFKEGMTRENNTPKGWHIDHIRPMSSFDLSDPAQLKECCHYTNLQPLWWHENLEKRDKIL